MNVVRLTIGIPTAGTVPMGFAYSLSCLTAYFGSQNGCPGRNECAIDVTMDVAESSVIHSNRAEIVKRAIKNKRTHLLFLDDDMTFQPGIIASLFSRRQEVVVTNYLIKSPTPEFVAVGLDGRRVPTTPESTGIVPISYSGFGASLFDVSVFKRTPKPWFLPEYSRKDDVYTTEDNPCFRKLRQNGVTVYLDHDASKLVTHIGRKGWSWEEWRVPMAQPKPTGKTVCERPVRVGGVLNTERTD